MPEKTAMTENIGNANPFKGKTGEIIEQLEYRLARGYYHFGDTISTNALIEEFKASRAPITAALNFLRGKGYLIVTPQVGCEVVSPSSQDIKDFFRFFGKLEAVVAELAAERIKPADIEILNNIVKNIKKSAPEKGAELTEPFLDGVTLFHETIRNIANSPMVAQRAASYWRFHEFLLFNGKINQLIRGLTIAHKERAQIVEAIAAGNAKKASKLMEEHVSSKPVRAGILDP